MASSRFKTRHIPGCTDTTREDGHRLVTVSQPPEEECEPTGSAPSSESAGISPAVSSPQPQVYGSPELSASDLISQLSVSRSPGRKFQETKCFIHSSSKYTLIPSKCQANYRPWDTPMGKTTLALEMHHASEYGLWNWTAWIRIPAMACASCMTLDKSLNPCVS